MKRQYILLVTVMIALIGASCATTDVASETQMAAISAVKINKEEPWTGTWKVTGNPYGGLVLNLKQSGNKIKSIRGSTHEFGGKVTGNRFKGWYMEAGTEL